MLLFYSLERVSCRFVFRCNFHELVLLSVFGLLFLLREIDNFQVPIPPLSRDEKYLLYLLISSVFIFSAYSAMC